LTSFPLLWHCMSTPYSRHSSKKLKVDQDPTSLRILPVQLAATGTKIELPKALEKSPKK
jgi:hypothetical protein